MRGRHRVRVLHDAHEQGADVECRPCFGGRLHEGVEDLGQLVLDRIEAGRYELFRVQLEGRLVQCHCDPNLITYLFRQSIAGEKCDATIGSENALMRRVQLRHKPLTILLA